MDPIMTIEKGTTDKYFSVQRTEDIRATKYPTGPYVFIPNSNGTCSLRYADSNAYIFQNLFPAQLINGETDTPFATIEEVDDYCTTNFFSNATGGSGISDLYLYYEDFYGANTDLHDAAWLIANPIGSAANPLRVTRLSMLATPVITFGAITSNTVALNWAAITNADNYIVSRNTVDDPTTAVEIYNGSNLTFEDTGLTADTQYFYYIKAQGAGYIDSAFGRNSTTTEEAVTSIFTHVTNVTINEGAKQGTSTGTALSAFALLAPIADGQTVLAYHDTSGDTLISDIEIMMSDTNNPATGQRLGGFFVDDTVITTVDNGVENYSGNDIHNDYFYVRRVGDNVEMGYFTGAVFYTAVGVLAGLSNVYVWFKFRVPTAGQYLTNITIE